MIPAEQSIPEDWKLTKIRDIAIVRSGSTPLRAQHDRYFKEGTFPWVKTMDLNNSHVFETDEKITETALQETSCPVLDEDTVLVAMYGGFNQIGRTGLLKVKASINQAISALIVDRTLAEPEYILNWLNANLDLWKEFAASSRKDPNITRSDVQGFPVFLPPLPEQRKIAAILSTWDEAVTLTEQLIAALQRRKQALMQLLLLHKHELPPDWRWARLREFLTLQNRWTTIEDNKLYQRCTVKWYNLGVFVRGTLQGYEIRTKRQQVTKEGDFIVAEIDAKEGGFGIVKADTAGSIVSSHYFLFEVADTVFKSYLDQCIQAGIFQAQVNAVGSTNYSSVRPEQIMEYRLPFPPLERQQQIADFLTACDNEIAINVKYLETLKIQKRGLMQQLLTGAVRVQVDE